MMRPIPLAEVVEVLQAKLPNGGEWRTLQPQPPLLPLEQLITGVCTDSRLVQPGDLFVALRGERTDGHQYLQEVFARGAVAALVEYIPLGAEEMPLLRVPSTVQALGKLAQHYRRQMPATVIGITGSTGKTTTKEMLACALEAEYPNAVHKNLGNYNTEIGVPLTLFGLEPHHRFLVQEMAMRGRGQIAYLAEIAEPRVGVLTQIGWSHVELLGSRQAIAEAKAELLEALPADGIAVLPRDDRFYEFLRSRCNCPVYTFGRHEEADAQLVAIELHPDRTVGTIRFAERVPLPSEAERVVVLDLPHLGEHLLYNACAALLTAALLGANPHKAARALQSLQMPEMRMNIQRQPDGWVLINDAYNANPDSMRSALNVLIRQAPARRRIAILGDMKELGAYSMRLHWHLGRWLATQPLDYLVLVGVDVLWTAAAAREGGFPPQRILHFETPLQAGEWLARHVQKGDWVLLKGSRAIGLEQALSRV
ncbi:MAG: UDP-N-acetylmuramoyl-tripeptide--D-alanyl-D-alanine ligase [Fimbriimonadales bacterium]|jgi:UDP-N-acetylmuramoyl-tripeptide--D-alanyl-D-alanine ligase|nr:UDP-N-acetylmuramoyl-tripeptide--D-alanyl-D-alanine ligase [Fimbriimonadales bacterium]GIV13764.1 MAG: UDP-N-acetylmuramoyl-tripeptide--D-alanyl-D-alanine ligase [Fimbriimonadales bacterium]CUU04256.1 UDP-N-acetylmuramoyl-tripeptide--D-alanyl-D-alanine ligase [Armatimonadetes bacterium GBS]CUU36488.1 UDP-N-acetylmuramoyl-tripeptide--D-alanyl-D-alanine ligase [Armatimonadetes bacterium GXS]